MIRSLSPYYLDIPFVSTNTGLTCTSYTVTIYVYDGLKADIVASGTLLDTITKDNPTGSTGNDTTVDIARLISDYIEFAPQTAGTTSVIDGNNQWWVRTSVTYITTDPADATTEQEIETNLYGLGYSYGNEDESVITVNDIMLDGTDFDISSTGIAVIPIKLDEAGLKTGSIVSNPDSNINVVISEAATTTSSELVKYAWIDASEAGTDTTITFTYDGNVVNYYLQTELKYTPYDIVFQNKAGAEQTVTFFKERKDSLSVTKSSYENDRGQPSAGFHQFTDFNLQGRESFTLSSGFVYEDLNNTYIQLLLSERVWIYESGKLVPVNVSKKDIKLKTQLNNKLINYVFDFEYSYNKVNNI